MGNEANASLKTYLKDNSFGFFLAKTIITGIFRGLKGTTSFQRSIAVTMVNDILNNTSTTPNYLYNNIIQSIPASKLAAISSSDKFLLKIRKYMSEEQLEYFWLYFDRELNQTKKKTKKSNRRDFQQDKSRA